MSIISEFSAVARHLIALVVAVIVVLPLSAWIIGVIEKKDRPIKAASKKNYVQYIPPRVEKQGVYGRRRG